MNRRDLLKLGASVASVPAVAGAQTADHAGHATDTVKAVQAAWQPALFDAHQNETVIALTELMIPATDTPGAKAAQVNRYIDLLLNDGPVQPREAFLAGLSWLDGWALKQYRRPFVKCVEAEQVKMLEAMDETGDADPGGRFFRQLKQLTTSVYYSTQIGKAELNKGGRVPASFGCKHPEHA